ncbi:hypothetical protein HK098_006397 [Nowakowskiella sp. JEL0407]|nr:hypothetical protein HK098_006397 [Nowakowskiella sp. JEL0407]
MALAPNSSLLLTIDEDGRSLLVNFSRKTVLHHHNFKSPVRHAVFSPDSKLIAITHDNHIQLWHSPSYAYEFQPFALHREYTGHFDQVVHITFSDDSKFFLTTSKDMTVRIYSVNPVDGFTPTVLTGHRSTVVGAWFKQEKKCSKIYSVSKDGSLFVWKSKDGAFGEEISDEVMGDAEKGHQTKKIKEEGKLNKPLLRSSEWALEQKHFFNQNHAKVVCADFRGNLMVVGFSSGVFGIWEMPDFVNIHSLSISQSKINTVSINASGEWLAFGCSKLGQLLVWEWQSESYVLKQQGHQLDMNALSYSQDGQFIATGGDDGKVKIWNTQSGFCFVTFTDHVGAVTCVEFAKQGQVVFSASLDGTVRAFDLVRYRNFRTFTSTSPVQFGSLAVDPSGEVVCAGTTDTFEIYVWSVQTGRLLDIVTGHDGPVSCMSFSPSDGHLVTGSWDKTVRVWNIFARDMSPESFDITSEVLALAFRPDGKEVAVSSLNGNITFWDLSTGTEVSSIEGRKDISGGRRKDDVMTAQNSGTGKNFTSLCYTSDGTCVIAGGNSKFVCIYDIQNRVLLKKFQTSHNLSLDAMHEFLNSRNMTEAGSLELIDDEEFSDLEDRLDKSLPGANKGDASERKTRPQVRSKCVRFSPTSRAWAAATTEGLLIFGLDTMVIFDPFNLDIDVTPATILETLDEKEYLKALIMGFRLGEEALISKVINSVPVDDVRLLVREFPQEVYLEKLIRFLVVYVEKSKRIEFALVWVNYLLGTHCRWIKNHSLELASAVRALQKCVSGLYTEISKVCDDNTFTMQYIKKMSEKKKIENSMMEIQSE